MLSLQIRLSDRQFNTLLALYFEQWEEEKGACIGGKRFYALRPSMPDNLFIVTQKALLTHGLVERIGGDGPYMKITNKGRKLCEAVCIEIREWSHRIAALERKTKRKVG